MADTTERVRANYDVAGLVGRIRTALAPFTSADQRLTVAQLAGLDQFHTRGILATAELAEAAGLGAGDAVLDLGCGIGGPARYLAATFHCTVTGVDLSASFVEAAEYLTARCGLADRVRCRVGDALHLPFEDGVFDVVFLQHVAMNIADRHALYAEVRRVLKPRGRFATYDVVLMGGEVLYPTPWARDASTSFLLSAADTRAALDMAGLKATLWRDDTQLASDWFSAAAAGPPPTGPNLGTVMGPDFAAAVSNFGRNVRERCVGVLSAVLTHA